MKDKKGLASLIIAIAALCISIVCLAFIIKGPKKVEPPAPVQVEEQGDTQYVLYLGTNDKDTNQPKFEPEEAKSILKGILIEHMGGYTIQEANGGWKDDEGTEYQEYTLVIYLSDTSIDEVHKLCDELIKEYNQSSILIQSNKTETEFYSAE